MNLLSRRIVQRICSFQQIVFLRSQSSTTRQEFGRQFEEIAAQSLRKFSFDVSVCGGPKDRGIDFRGVWLLKSSSVPVIGQCRRYKKRLGPRHVRELEGTLTHEVKGTLGIIVTESGYTKDAYEVFMGSTYPVVLTTLIGYSDDLLHWYSTERNDEQCVGKCPDSTGSDLLYEAQCKSTDKPFLQDYEVVDDFYSNFAESSYNKETLVNDNHQYSVCDDKKGNVTHHNLNQENTNYDNKVELNIGKKSDGHDSLRISEMDNRSQTNSFTDIGDDAEQFIHSDISEIGRGVFTMFELNPTARKLLPNLVVGMKYRRHNSKDPDIFINEDDSFVSVTE